MATPKWFSRRKRADINAIHTKRTSSYLENGKNEFWESKTAYEVWYGQLLIKRIQKSRVIKIDLR